MSPPLPRKGEEDLLSWLLRVVAHKHEALALAQGCSVIEGGDLLLAADGPGAAAWDRYEALHQQETWLHHEMTR